MSVAPDAALLGSVARARSENEAASLLMSGAPGTRVIAGGSDLMLHMARGRAQPVALVDIRRASMDRLDLGEAWLSIGATATAAQLSRWQALRDHAPSLWEAASTLSVPQIRNVATLGGNLANASPAADMVPPVLALGGVVEVRRGDSVRSLSAEALALGPGRTSLAADELVSRILVPRWSPRSFHWFTKLGYRDAQIIAVVSLALSCELEGDVVRKVHIALGSVAPRVVRAHAVEDFLLGQRLCRSSAEEALRLLATDICPIDDVRGSAAHRLAVARNYLGDALARAWHYAQGATNPHASLAALRDPSPRPPALQHERTDVLHALQVPAGTEEPLIVSTSPLSYAPASPRTTTKKPAATKKKRSPRGRP
ncbi:MAG: FAD binding domain-containing protein [Myxococcota bacterium]